MNIFRNAIIVLSLLLLTADGSFAQNRRGKGGRPPAPVMVSTVDLVQDSVRASFTGTLQPTFKALLSSDVAGRLIRLTKRAGDRVRKGEVLAILKNSTLEQDLAVMQAKVRQTEAQLALSVQQQKRIVTLYKKKLASAQRFEDGEANLGVARARLEGDQVQADRLQDQLNRMVIRSPMWGQIISSKGQIGQWITPNQTLFEIYNYSRLELLVGVPGRYLRTIRSRGSVQVNIPEAKRTLRGRIAGVIRHVDPATGNFHIRIVISNPRNLPLSGLLAKVNLPLARASRRLTVPRDAIVRRGKRTHVVLVVRGKARIVPVKVLGNLGGSVIVQGKGLRAKAKVVVRGNERLFPGMPVRIAGSIPEKAKRKL